jgi:CBS domain-containing membrane protein
VDKIGYKKDVFVEMSDADVLKAMADMQGYIDITPADFREVYRAAFTHALQRMLSSIKAKNIMSRPVQVVSQDMDLARTATLLAEKKISGAPVVDEHGRVVGVVSEKDFIKNMDIGNSGSFMGVIADCLKNKECLARPMRAKTIRDIMTAPAITAREDISVGEISALFMEKRINRLPIVDSEEKAVGIVARSDMVNVYCMIG